MVHIDANAEKKMILFKRVNVVSFSFFSGNQYISLDAMLYLSWFADANVVSESINEGLQ